MEEVRDLKERLLLPHSNEITEDGGQKRLSERLEHTECVLSMEARVCIYRVHDGLRNAENEAYYKPLLVSIGPYHHGNQKLSALMQQHKLRYLNSFLKRTGKSLDRCRSIVEEYADSALECYAGPIGMTRNEFVEMMLLDSCFIIEFLFRLRRRRQAYRSDPILKDPWMLSQVVRDLLLLENQVPFRLPFGLLCDTSQSGELLKTAESLVTRMLQFKLPSSKPRTTAHEYKHFLDLVTQICEPSKKEEKTGTLDMPCVKELRPAGATFGVNKSDNVKEEEETGTLCMPRVKVSQLGAAFGFNNSVEETDTLGMVEEGAAFGVDNSGEEEETGTLPMASAALEGMPSVKEFQLGADFSRVMVGAAFGVDDSEEEEEEETGLMASAALGVNNRVETGTLMGSAAAIEVNNRVETGTLTGSAAAIEVNNRVETGTLKGSAAAIEVNNRLETVILRVNKSNNVQEEEKTGTLSMPCVKELQQGSIAFKVNDSDKVTPFDIEFDSRHCLRRARLKIPRLTVDDRTETLLRNIIAYEQHNFNAEFRYFTDYTHFLDKLINSEEDVTYLRLHKIIHNMLGDDKEVANLINRLGNGIIIDKGKYYYSPVCQQVNDHYGKTWNQNMATLRRKYFNNPWAWISTFAGLLLLFLTTTATVVSLINAFT